jgi:hypothetical protein
MSKRLNWQEKFAAVQVLGEASLRMRKPGDWYVSQMVEVLETEDSSVLVGRYGNGSTPKEAVEDHFNTLTAEQPLHCVVVDAMSTRDVRRHVRWNGFMWVTL